MSGKQLKTKSSINSGRETLGAYFKDKIGMYYPKRLLKNANENH